MNPTTATIESDTANGTRRSLVLVAAAALLALLATLLAPASAHAATRTTTRHVPTRTVAAPHRTVAENTYAGAVLNLMNAERRANHLPALSTRPELLVSARRHNLSMAKADTMSHQVRGEANLGQRIDAAGYRWTFNGENIGYNSDISVTGVLTLQKMMYNEVAPNNGHRLNILGRQFRNAGVDVYVDSAHHKVWLTVDFGTK